MWAALLLSGVRGAAACDSDTCQESDGSSLLQSRSQLHRNFGQWDAALFSRQFGDLNAQLSDARIVLDRVGSMPWQATMRAENTLPFAEQLPASQQLLSGQLYNDQMPPERSVAPPFLPPAQAFAPPFAQPLELQPGFGRPLAQQELPRPPAQYPSPPFVQQVPPYGRVAEQMTAPMTQLSVNEMNLAAQSGRRLALLESEANEAAVQLLREHEMRKSAEVRAASAESQQRAAEHLSAELQAAAADAAARVSSAKAVAADATARAEAAEASLERSSVVSADATAKVAEARQRVAQIKTEEAELTDEARQAVKTAKAEADAEVLRRAQKLSEAQVGKIRAEESAREAQVELAAREAVDAAQAEARKEIALAQQEVAAEVQATRASVERAQQLIRGVEPEPFDPEGPCD